MSVQDLTNAIITGINAGAEQFLEGTLAAVLPILWLAILGLHLGRPYILEMIDRFTLRLGADLLWLVYVALRDLLIVSGVVMSFMFFFPDVVTTDALPLTGGLAAAALFGVLLVKLVGDPDHNLRDFRLVTGLVGLGDRAHAPRPQAHGRSRVHGARRPTDARRRVEPPTRRGGRSVGGHFTSPPPGMGGRRGTG